MSYPQTASLAHFKLPAIDNEPMVNKKFQFFLFICLKIENMHM